MTLSRLVMWYLRPDDQGLYIIKQSGIKLHFLTGAIGRIHKKNLLDITTVFLLNIANFHFNTLDLSHNTSSNSHN